MTLTDHDYELISAYIDDGLTTTARAAFESRLAAEPALRDALTDARQAITLIKTLPTLKAPRDFTLTPAMVSAPLTVLPKQKAPTRWLPLLSAAASFVLVLIGGLMLIESPSANSSIMPDTVAMQLTETYAPVAAGGASVSGAELAHAEEILTDEMPMMESVAPPIPQGYNLEEPGMSAEGNAKDQLNDEFSMGAYAQTLMPAETAFELRGDKDIIPRPSPIFETDSENQSDDSAPSVMRAMPPATSAPLIGGIIGAADAEIEVTEETLEESTLDAAQTEEAADEVSDEALIDATIITDEPLINEEIPLAPVLIGLGVVGLILSGLWFYWARK